MVCSPINSRMSSMAAVYGKPRSRTQSLAQPVVRKGGAASTGTGTMGGGGGSVEISGVDM